VILLSTYALFIALILHPTIQAHNVFLHSINIPFHFDISKPKDIKSLPSGKVRNFQVEAIDGVRISGWHLLPDDVDSLVNRGEDDYFDRALQHRATMICERILFHLSKT
jgi:abhydrolase domain-containing protein 12